MKLKNSVVTGIEPTTSDLLDQRHSRSDNQAPRLLWEFGKLSCLDIVQRKFSENARLAVSRLGKLGTTHWHSFDFHWNNFTTSFLPPTFLNFVFQQLFQIWIITESAWSNKSYKISHLTETLKFSLLVYNHWLMFSFRINLRITT